MSKSKTFKNYCSFWKAVAMRIPKKKHFLISGNMVDLGYAIKTRVEFPFVKVSYSLNPDIVPTVEDVEKVVKRMGE